MEVLVVARICSNCLCACVVGVHLSMGGAEEWDIATAKEKIRDCFGDHTADF